MALLNLKRILVDVLPSLALKEPVQLLRIPNHLEMLGESLWAINAMLFDAYIKSLFLKEMEKFNLKDDLLDVELLPDEWLKDVDSAAMDVETMLNDILDWTRRATAAASNSNLSIDGAQVMMFRHFILKELKEMACKLNFLRRRGFALGLQTNMLESMHPLREEYSDILRDDVVRLQKNKDNIMQILQEGNIDLGVLSIILIRSYYRMARKTTLALMVYHGVWVRQSFQHRVWVNAFHIWDYQKIAGEIVTRIIGKESYDADWSVVRDLLGESRFLLILDDFRISEEDEDKWKALKHILRRIGGPGSAVILTSQYYPNSWSPKAYILDQQTIVSAFFDLHPWDIHTREMYLMRNVLNAMHYNYTYKRRQLYNSLFPEDGMLNNEDVLHLLIVEDIVPITSDAKILRHDYGEIIFRHDNDESSRVLDKEIEEFCFMMRNSEGRKIPEECLYLSLLVDSQTSFLFPPTLLLGLNNKLRALLILHREKEEDKKYQATPAEIPKHIFSKLAYLRILYLRAVRIQKLPKSIGKLHRLRYLKLHMLNIVSLPQTLCKLFNLRILSFDHCEELRRLPKQIHKLQNLRILKLAYCTKLQKLPGSLTKLVNLQELDVQGCHWLKELPGDLSNLKNLAKLNIAECASLTRMPPKIGELTRLQKLSRYIAVYDDNRGKSICAIPELQTLINLQQLHVQNLERVSNFAEDVQAAKAIQENTRLEHLALEWEWWDMDSVAEAASIQIIAECFEPNSNLRMLEMVCYMEKELPGWMKEEGVSSHLNFLVEIRLVNLKRCERLPPLGQLPFLENVEISGMDSIKVVDDAFFGQTYHTFRSLKKLTFSEMLTMEEWHVEGPRYPKPFPKLRELTLIQCPRFRGFDKRIASEGIKMRMWLNNETLLTSELEHSHYSYRGQIKELEIVGCQELRCLPQTMKYYLYYLKTLRIVGCNQLVALPDWLQYLECLRELTILCCPALRYIPERFLKENEFQLSIMKGSRRLRHATMGDGFQLHADDRG